MNGLPILEVKACISESRSASHECVVCSKHLCASIAVLGLHVFPCQHLVPLWLASGTCLCLSTATTIAFDTSMGSWNTKRLSLAAGSRASGTVLGMHLLEALDELRVLFKDFLRLHSDISRFWSKAWPRSNRSKNIPGHTDADHSIARDMLFGPVGDKALTNA